MATNTLCHTNNGFIVDTFNLVSISSNHTDETNESFIGFDLDYIADDSKPNMITVLSYRLNEKENKETRSKLYKLIKEMFINKFLENRGITIHYSDNGDTVTLVDGDEKINKVTMQYGSKDFSSKEKSTTEENNMGYNTASNKNGVETQKIVDKYEKEDNVDLSQSRLETEFKKDDTFSKQIALSSIKQIENYINTTYAYVEETGYLSELDRKAILTRITSLLQNVPTK